MPGHADNKPETATLSVGEAAPHNSRKTIGSAIYIGDDGTLVMDERWINRYLTIVKTAQGATYRSVKRELFEHYHLSGNERKELSRRLASIYEELLWLALDPANSSTVRALAAAGYDSATKAWIENGGFDVRSIDDRPLKLVAAVEGFDLCICVPNSLMPKDVETLLGAARIAANKVLERLRGSDEYDAANPVITAVREGEAVAWALHEYALDLSGDVVILDVGAGTTDAALVRYGRTGNRKRSRLVEYRTGAPFGGDDLDMLLLCEAAEEAAQGPRLGYTPIPLAELSRDERNELIQLARGEKEAWVVGAPENSIWVTVPSADLSPTVDVVSATTANVPLYAIRLSDNTRTLESVVPVVNPHAEDSYSAFLRYTVYLSCAALFRRLQGHAVSAIILTGQSSLALGILPYVAALAEHFGISVPPDWVRHLDARDSQVMKLVCAEGAAKYAGECASQPETLGDIVPETFVLFHEDERMDLFPAGSRSQQHQVNAMIALEYGGSPHSVLRYYCSPQDLVRDDLKRDWARKPVGIIGGDGRRKALAFRLDLMKERIKVWALNEMGKVTKLDFQESPDIRRGKPPDHPFLKTGGKPLQLTWQSKG